MSRKSFIAPAALVVLVAAGLTLWFQPPSPAPVPMPSPNGYDDFRKAGRVYVEPSLADHNYWELNHERLRAVVLPNAETLKLVRVGLSRQCRVPVGSSENYDEATLIRDLMTVKQLAVALKAEGLLAEMEHRINAAVMAHLDNIRLSRESSYGGLVLHGLTSQAVEALGVEGFQRLTPGLDAPTCRDIIKALELLEAKRESPEEILRREKEWTRKNYGVMTRISWMIANKSFDSIAGLRVKFVQKMNDQQRQTGLLLIDLAARAFELEKGRRPTSVRELVPTYLKAMLKDPTTGADLALPRQ